MDMWYIIMGIIAMMLFFFGFIFGLLEKKYKRLGETAYFNTGMFDLTSIYANDIDNTPEILEDTTPVIISSTSIDDDIDIL